MAKSSHDVALEKIREAYAAVSVLIRSRESAVALTKLDEARHWVADDRFRTELASSGQ